MWWQHGDPVSIVHSACKDLVQSRITKSRVVLTGCKGQHRDEAPSAVQGNHEHQEARLYCQPYQVRVQAHFSMYCFASTLPVNYLVLDWSKGSFSQHVLVGRHMSLSRMCCTSCRSTCHKCGPAQNTVAIASIDSCRQSKPSRNCTQLAG